MSICASNTMAQNVGIGTVTPNASAMLDITATNKGLLAPRVALTDNRDVVTVPAAANALLIYNTATAGIRDLAVAPGFYYWDVASTTWIKMITENNIAAWQLAGNANTSVATDFIGTTDNQSLQFKIFDTPAGFLGTSGNSYWGLNSGNINNAGIKAIGTNNAAALTIDGPIRALTNNARVIYKMTAQTSSPAADG